MLSSSSCLTNHNKRWRGSIGIASQEVQRAIFADAAKQDHRDAATEGLVLLGADVVGGGGEVGVQAAHKGLAGVIMVGIVVGAGLGEENRPGAVGRALDGSPAEGYGYGSGVGHVCVPCVRS